MAWLSQSPCCTENGANEGYFFVDPGLLSLLPIESTDEYTGLAAFFRLCDRGTPPPIYLFLRPLSLMNMSEVISWTSGQTQSHFWSLDEEGRSQLTEQELEQLGVPELRPSTWLHVELISWSNDTYTALRDWQVAHGFDPATTDFTRYLELPELDILRRKTRFEEVVADGKNARYLVRAFADIILRRTIKLVVGGDSWVGDQRFRFLRKLVIQRISTSFPTKKQRLGIPTKSGYV
ncbi:hypothetical protein VNI00_011594 [Paramarasmius palmivorus]|uniref:Uncharacterized protein n=1 Tax=Paramarasmius palmivorus TaxID=297713 RepID=A0AAW0CBR4_9AGAR